MESPLLLQEINNAQHIDQIEKQTWHSLTNFLIQFSARIVNKMGATRAIRSEPKKRVIEVIKVGKDLSIEFPIETDKADNFIQSMKVEMSRIKTKVKERGKTPKPISMEFVKLPCEEEPGKVTLKVIHRLDDRKMHVDKVIDEIFSDIAV